MGNNKELIELEHIARVATFAALESYEPVPEAWRTNLTLGTVVENDFRTFELYVPGARPQDAITISSARVHRETKDVEVVITNLAKRVSA
ncbi:hypothetical protein CSQ96_19160 [Janthinobacterium sp. BJB412]|nr:hypothetical protein CSQ96_19160 [Janthinobacterium sp. BJB412]